jgi:hypothetical protein
LKKLGKFVRKRQFEGMKKHRWHGGKRRFDQSIQIRGVEFFCLIRPTRRDVAVLEKFDVLEELVVCKPMGACAG